MTKVILFGATGMVGSGVLYECLDSPRVSTVLVIGRTASGIAHEKMRELLHGDFLDFEPLRDQFASADACFFCLGVSSAGMREAAYTRITHDFTVAAAKAMIGTSPQLTFIYVSGEGTDSSERGRTMWARVNGRTENELLAMPFKAAYMFRPGYIQPLRGVRTKTALYGAIYGALAWFYPVLQRVAPKFATTTVNVGRAMIEVAAEGYARPIVLTKDINALAELAEDHESEGPPAALIGGGSR